MPYTDCPAIPFLAPNWRSPYIWSTYPERVNRSPRGLMRHQKDSLETNLAVEEAVKSHGHAGAGHERVYRPWDSMDKPGIAWSAGGLDSSLQGMRHRGMIPDLNADLKSDDKAKDMAAVSIVEKLLLLMVSRP